MSTVLIGLAGRRRSGKSTMAKVLEQKYGFVRAPVATCLRDAVQAALGLTDHQLHEGKDERLTRALDVCHCGSYPCSEQLRERLQRLGLPNVCAPELHDILTRSDTPRQLLQGIAQLARGTLGDNIWAQLWAERNSDILGRVDVVVDDVRFPSEREIIRDRGGALVMIKCTTDGAEEDVDQHVTEQSWGEPDEYDLVISAERGDLDGLEMQLLTFIEDRVESGSKSGGGRRKKTAKAE
ncbi:MAG: hypothetical protein GF320_14230 [Armatimonadia bacterium]|nr:hypothetical protein [Armatimonadia bacterium]